MGFATQKILHTEEETKTRASESLFDIDIVEWKTTKQQSFQLWFSNPAAYENHWRLKKKNTTPVIIHTRCGHVPISTE